MDEFSMLAIRETYDRLADEYARRFVNELQQKPLDRELLSRFAREVANPGEVCDIGCDQVTSRATFVMPEQRSSVWMSLREC